MVDLPARSFGKLSGAWLGARVSHADAATRRWMGLAMLPQAGVAIGMALLAANRLPEHRQMILFVVISTTVMVELLGPTATRWAIRKAAGR